MILFYIISFFLFLGGAFWLFKIKEGVSVIEQTMIWWTLAVCILCYVPILNSFDGTASEDRTDIPYFIAVLFTCIACLPAVIGSYIRKNTRYPFLRVVVSVGFFVIQLIILINLFIMWP